MYEVTLIRSPFDKRLVHIARSIEIARERLTAIGEIICFETDAAADHDAADAAVLVNGALEIFAIERCA